MHHSAVLKVFVLVSSTVRYDLIVIFAGQTTDEKGNAKPVAIMQYRVNGQYIMEGLAASFMFSLGGTFFLFCFALSPLLICSAF